VIETVLGPVAPAALGRCLPHEHAICDFEPAGSGGDHLLNEPELIVAELAPFRVAGGMSIVEVTPPDLGRDPLGLREISRRSGVHIVMGTGWYRRAYYPARLDRTPTAAIAKEMIVELRDGVGDTGIRAGLIGELGVDRDHISAVEERVHRAAARAAIVTGCAVSTHSSMFPVGLAQLELLMEEGLAPERVVIGHADTFIDTGYHDEVLDRGAYLQFDTFGRQHMNPDERRVAALLRLVRAGRLERLLLSSDRCRRSDLVAFGGVGYAHVLTTVRDRLLELGLSAAEFDVITIENPARMLSIHAVAGLSTLPGTG